MKPYYENVSQLKELRELSAPAETDFKKGLEIITDDNELTLYFYDVLDPGWIELLDEAGEFEELREKKAGVIDNYKAHYLKNCAETKAETVLGIIEKIDAQDINIQGTLIRAIVKMSEETAIKGIGVVTKYLDGQENKWWYSIGESSAELMVNLMVNHPDKAFEVAEALLDAWVSEERTYGEDIVAKFSKNEYSKLMLEHYKKVWEAKPEQAVRVLVKILNRCLENLDKEGEGEKGYDASISFGYGLRCKDLNEIDIRRPEIKTVLVKGICEAGRVLIDKEQGKVSKFLDLLEGTNRVIFLRIAMYLLRFVQPGTEKERISRLVRDKEYFKEYHPCWNEHRRLLNDKFDDVSDKDKKAFLEWVDEDKYSKDQRKEVTERYKQSNAAEPDFEKWENFAKAEQLYLVRERFKNEYERYKNAAGVKNDSELAPRKMVSEGRFVSPMEGTPLTSEKMAEKKVNEVLDYLLNPKSYEGENKVSGWGTVKDALAATFKNDVKKRVGDYLGCDVEKLVTLGPDFLSSLFYGFREVEKIEREVWGQALELASEVVKNSGTNEKYRACYSAILSALRDGFREKEDEGIEFTEGRVKEFWGIIETLTRYPVEDKSQSSNYQRDPVQMGCVLVPGQAMELSVSLGIVCKKYFPEFHESYLKEEIQKCYEKVLKIKEPGVNCRFGSDFARIYWTDTEWVKKNLGNIFSNDLWDETWGTYVSWGRPSPKCFELLVQEKQYLEAVKRIGKPNKFKFDKEPDKGLIEHLMIGYFNGWIDYEHEVLQQFFEKAPASLRAKAARFLTTGFKGTKEGDDEKYRREVAERMREYWRKRLAVMDKEEVIGFMKWVSDSVLDGKETLEFVEKTLHISGGKLGKHGDIKGFVEWVCELGQKEGNELLALQCLKLAVSDKNMHTTWASIQDPLVNFLGAMVDMPEDVRGAAKEVVDAYGRYNPDKFRGVWAELNEKR
jgi:hypothetical protein